MREQINDQEANVVTGGRYYLNVDKMKVTFSTTGATRYYLDCNPYEAMAAMDALASQYKDAASYDAACIQLLQDNGWIDHIK